MDFLKTVSLQLEKPLAENTGSSIDDATNRVINKECIISQGMCYLFKNMKDWETKLNKLQNDYADKVTKNDLAQRFKKVKTKIRQQFNDEDKKLAKKLHDLEKHFNQQHATAQINLTEMEKKTLWKIQDCETLLHKRINSEFVDNACKSVYERVMKEMEKMKDSNFKQIHSEIFDLRSRLQTNEDQQNEKLKSMRQLIKDFQDLLNHKFCTLERLEITKNSLMERINEIQVKMQDMTRRLDAANALEKQIPIINGLEDQMSDAQHSLELLRKELEVLKVMLEQMGEMSGGGGGKSDIDPHKVCQIDAEVKRLKSDSSDMENRIRLLEMDSKRKIDQLEQRLVTQVSLLKQNGGQGGVPKEEVLLIVERELGMPNSVLRARIIGLVNSALNSGNGQPLDQVINGLKNELAELSKKTEGLMDLEKRMKKKFRQLTSNDSGDINKLLAQQNLKLLIWIEKRIWRRRDFNFKQWRKKQGLCKTR